jgi:hypothetical protein
VSGVNRFEESIATERWDGGCSRAATTAVERNIPPKEK